MDQVTQQNAAMVEQSTAASHGLSQETAELVRLTGQFQVGAMDPPPARALPVKMAPRAVSHGGRACPGVQAEGLTTAVTRG